MQHLTLVSSVLLSVIPYVYGQVLSAGACGPTSVANVPGCWGLPGCAYVIAGPGAACSYDYCNCGGTNVPLLPETLSNTTTIGCASYTTQPSANNCPTAAAVAPDPGAPGSRPSSAVPSTTAPSSPQSSPPTGATVVTSTISGQTIIETFTPTTYTQFATVTNTITTTILGASSSPTTIIVGPSGVAWTPINQIPGVPDVAPPSLLPGAPPPPSSSVPLLPGGTVVTATIGSTVLTETFVPTTLSGYASLASTITTTSLDSQSSPYTVLIGPGGIKWTPLSLPSGVPEVPPPTVLPFNPNAPSITPPGSTLSSSAPSLTASSTTPSTITPESALPSGTVDAGQASITDAFANTALSETTIIAGGVTEHWSKATFADLSTVTAPTTITTPIAQTNRDGSQFTISAAIIVVGPGGVWWNGGTGGWGLQGPSCIWPFCPPGPPGGGDIGGAGSGTSPTDPNSPNSPEKPSDPDDDDNKSQSQKSSDPSSTITSQFSSSSASISSCSASTIASDCSVICSMATSTSSQYCSTTCYSTVTGCGATGTTEISTATGASCTKPTGWGNVVDGDDSPDYEPLGTAGIAAPGGVIGGASGSLSATGSSGSTRGSTATTASSSGSSSAPLTSTLPNPTCMADGAPWYSPTSWCDCGTSSTYPTLSATSGATTANCAYTSLPVSTIQPVSTSAAPTNIPGQGGVPGCAAVVSNIGTSAYCNCGGTPAPTLSPTSPGLLNCYYTIQPTSSYNPAIPPPSSAAAPAPPYATGKCNVHIWQGLGQELGDPEVVIDVNITDAKGSVIGYGSSKLNWAQEFGVDSKLPYVLEVTPRIKNKRLTRASLGKRAGPAIPPRPLYEKAPVDFAIGSQSWDSTSSQCSVGAWDNGDANDFFGALIFGDDPLPNRQMDCKFDCPGPSSKKRAVTERLGPFLEQDDEWKRDLKNHLARYPSSTTDNDPSPVDEQLFDVRALNPRAPHSAAWVKYAPSGARYYQAWQDKTGDDAVYQCNFDDDFDVTLPVKFAPPARGIQPALQAAGYGIGREYYAIIATGPKNAADGPFADFTNTISATQGVFLANANDRGALPSDPNDPMYNPAFPTGREPVPWQFSSVAWWMWTKTVLTQNPAWAADPSQADYSGIKSFWRREIDNADTKSILDDAFAGKDVTSTQTWTPEDPDQDANPFWALLGSPNGNGIQYFLTDNKVALKGKGIVSISATTVQSGDGKYYSMWATFG